MTGEGPEPGSIGQEAARLGEALQTWLAQSLPGLAAGLSDVVAGLAGHGGPSVAGSPGSAPAGAHARTDGGAGGAAQRRDDPVHRLLTLLFDGSPQARARMAEAGWALSVTLARAAGEALTAWAAAAAAGRPGPDQADGPAGSGPPSSPGRTSSERLSGPSAVGAGHADARPARRVEPIDLVEG